MMVHHRHFVHMIFNNREALCVPIDLMGLKRQERSILGHIGDRAQQRACGCFIVEGD